MDNLVVNPGSGGATLASDEIQGVHYPRSKIVIGDDGQAVGDVSKNNPMPVIDSESQITPLSVTANAAGETVVVAPSAGKSIRLWWYNLAANPANAAHVLASLRFGSGSTDFYKTALSQYGAATAHSFKAGKSYYQGAVNAPLLVNLDSAQTVYVNIDYQEV